MSGRKERTKQDDAREQKKEGREVQVSFALALPASLVQRCDAELSNASEKVKARTARRRERRDILKGNRSWSLGRDEEVSS